MLLKYFYDQKLAQASYMVGCQKTGEALVVDAARDIQPYLDMAEAEGLTIRTLPKPTFMPTTLVAAVSLLMQPMACSI